MDAVPAPADPVSDAGPHAAPPPAGATVRAPGARDRLIAAAHSVVRRQGYAGTSVDNICAAAGVTKGAFFHHFASKEALAVAAAQGWTARAAPMFDGPPHTRLDDPLDRLLGHLDFRLALLDGPIEDFTCFVGTMVQEAFATSDAIRAACEASITAYCNALVPDIDAAIARHGIADGVSAPSLARHVQAVLQGAFVLAKSAADPAIARDSVIHLKRYIRMLFGRR